jgi:tripartite-type tricarboxylate transporter receptor subunit TctC
VGGALRQGRHHAPSKEHSQRGSVMIELPVARAEVSEGRGSKGAIGSNPQKSIFAHDRRTQSIARSLSVFWEDIMKIPRRQFLHQATVVAAGAILSVTLSGQASWSQAPRTIKIVVPFAAGGGTDTVARLLAEQIGRSQGPTMLIENRPGAGSVIGTETVSRAAPDGNTLLITTSDFLIGPHLRKLNFGPLTSFKPICYLVNSPLLIVVNSTSPYGTLADLLNAARAKPGELTLASNGPATAYQIAFEMFKRAAKVDMIFVPYPGVAPAVTALMGEHVTSYLGSYTAVAEQLNAGKLRALATPSRTRIEPLPDVPTVAESGYKDYEASTWNGLFAPAKTPDTTVSQLAGWFTAALLVPEVKAKLIALGQFPVGTCGTDFDVFIRKQYDDFGRAIRESNIKSE